MVSATQTVLSGPSEGKVCLLLPPAFLDYAAEVISNASIPGLTLGVVRIGEDGQPISEYAAWGRRTEETEGDMTPDTLFGIASCSKAYVVASMGILMDDFAHGRNSTPLPSELSRFDWDTKIADVLPDEWKLQDEISTRLSTFRDAFSHVTGMPSHDFTYRVGDTVHDVLMRQRELRGAYELREKWSYNNQMYMLGAHVVAKLSGMTFPDFVAARIFKPLNMSSSTYRPSAARATGKLTQTWTPWRGAVRRIPFWFSDEAASMNAVAGGVISNAEDSTKWLAMWLNKGVDPVSGKTIIPRDVYETATTARTIVHGARTPAYGPSVMGYGAGWRRWTFKGIEIVHHDGGIPGFSISTQFSPSHNIGVVIMANVDGAQMSNLAIVKRLYETVLGLDGHDPFVVHPSVPDRGPSLRDSSSLPLEAYTGTYSAPGYGAVTLCSPSSTSHYCAGVLGDFATLEDLGVPPANASLFAAHHTLLSTHLRLRHDTRDVFDITFTALFPRGYGNDTSAFETYERGDAEGKVEFVVEGGAVKGFALIMDEDAACVREKRVGPRPEQRADAWFTRV